MKQSTLLLALMITLSFSCVKAQDPDTELTQKVDQFFKDVAGKESPGTAILIQQGGKILLNKGYGMANLEHQIPITPNTVFDLASVSKQFTGYAISTLVEEGKIDLKDDIRKHIPEVPDFGPTITVEHLVHHTSGIRDWTSTLPLAGWSFDDVISFEQILRMTYMQKELNFEPGSQYTYSNAGYNLLAELVERVSGVSFREWTDKHIFQELGMKNTFFLDDHTETIPNRASGYQNEEDKFHHTPNNLTALGSSSMYSTTTDLAKWTNHLINPKGSQKPIVERMFQTVKLNNGEENTYAFGLGINEFRGTRWISHTGSWASFTSVLVVLPDHRLSIVVLSNRRTNNYGYAREIAAMFVTEKPTDKKQEPEASKDASPAKVSTKTLDEYTGTYKLGPAWYVTISRKDKKLWTQATNEDQFPMITESDTVFRIKAYGNRTMTFFRNDAGEVTHMKYAGMECPKLDESTAFNQAQIKEYLGEYFSEELQTSYQVITKEDELKFKHHRHGILSLSPAWGDEFAGSSWFIQSVEFVRDDQNKIKGLKVTNQRARGQWFEKVH